MSETVRIRTERPCDFDEIREVVKSAFAGAQHYRRSNWYARFARNRKAVPRILWWVFLLTVVSGIVATILWLDGGRHSHIGAVHGKIGFLMVLMAIIHVARKRVYS